MNSQGNRKRRWAILLLAAVLLVFMLRWFVNSQVYHPSRSRDANGSELNRPFEDVFFDTTDGVKLNGWFFPADTNATHRALAVLVCHGNAGNITHRLGLCRALLATGVNVFLLDYRGYGRSAGRPSEEGTYRDAQAAYRWLRAKGFAATNIVAYGESLGGAVAAELAMREPLGGLVLQSTFTSIPDIGAELFPWLPARWITTIRYDTHSKLPLIRIPVLVMHSRTDDLIGFRHSERNFAAANQPKWFYELAGRHNDPAGEQEWFRAGMEELLRHVGGASPPPPAAGPR